MAPPRGTAGAAASGQKDDTPLIPMKAFLGFDGAPNAAGVAKKLREFNAGAVVVAGMDPAAEDVLEAVEGAAATGTLGEEACGGVAVTLGWPLEVSAREEDRGTVSRSNCLGAARVPTHRRVLVVLDAVPDDLLLRARFKSAHQAVLSVPLRARWRAHVHCFHLAVPLPDAGRPPVLRQPLPRPCVAARICRLCIARGNPRGGGGAAGGGWADTGGGGDDGVPGDEQSLPARGDAGVGAWADGGRAGSRGRPVLVTAQGAEVRGSL